MPTTASPAPPLELDELLLEEEELDELDDELEEELDDPSSEPVPPQAIRADTPRTANTTDRVVCKILAILNFIGIALFPHCNGIDGSEDDWSKARSTGASSHLHSLCIGSVDAQLLSV